MHLKIEHYVLCAADDAENALEYEAIRHYAPLLTDPSLVAGDWNLGPTIANREYRKILSMLEERGLKCLFQTFKAKNPNAVDLPTYRPVRGKNFHKIDHAMGSSWFQENLRSFDTRPLSEAVLSDHAPIVLEFGDGIKS